MSEKCPSNIKTRRNEQTKERERKKRQHYRKVFKTKIVPTFKLSTLLQSTAVNRHQYYNFPKSMAVPKSILLPSKLNIFFSN